MPQGRWWEIDDSRDNEKDLGGVFKALQKITNTRCIPLKLPQVLPFVAEAGEDNYSPPEGVCPGEEGHSF